jgi:predicted metal-dependent enzyme (double-stranded beta helix superfamily)
MTPFAPALNGHAQDLIRRLDGAVAAADTALACQNVKRVLEDVVCSETQILGDPFLEPAPGTYARRLLHRDPGGRYTVVVMVWDRGQGTPLHDHSGIWCVECVYRGRIEVSSFDIKGDPSAAVVDFVCRSDIVAGVGEAGALIPPFEYHWIRNPDPTAAVTVHVYGGEMNRANTFLPLPGGGYRRETHELSYTTG